MIVRLIAAMAAVHGAAACATARVPADPFTVERDLYERIHRAPPDFFLVSAHFAEVTNLPADGAWNGIPVYRNPGQVDAVVAVGESPGGLRLSRLPTLEPVDAAPGDAAGAPAGESAPSAPGTPSGSPPGPRPGPAP